MELLEEFVRITTLLEEADEVDYAVCGEFAVTLLGHAKMKRQAGRPQDIQDLENLGIE